MANNNTGPRPPLEENFHQNLFIDDCITNPQNLVILPPDCHLNSIENSSQLNKITVDVVKANNPSFCYMRINHISPIDLSHHYPGWGCVYFGVILPKVQDGVFQMQNPNKAQKVAIKRLSRSVVCEYLSKGGNENPYKEIQRMQTIGDNHHVLGIYEALQDEQFLYIITKYCEGGNLVPWIFQKRDHIHEKFGGFAAVYQNILENVDYLHRNYICHRDLSPDNCMVLNRRIVFNDLAMSFRIPQGGITSRTGGFFGKTAYLPPEIVSGFHYFKATSCDLWSSVVILFNLVTGEIAWETSLPTDRRFRYLVLAGGLSRIPVNERTVEMLADEPITSDLRSLAEICMNLNPAVADLLEGVLKLDPNQRWKTDQVKNCLWLEASRQLG